MNQKQPPWDEPLRSWLRRMMRSARPRLWSHIEPVSPLHELGHAALTPQATLLLNPWVRTGMITGAIFGLDCLTPSSIGVGVVYVATVLSAASLRYPRAIYLTATICSLLVFVGWYLSPNQAEMEWWKVAINRMLACFVIWAVAAIVVLWNRSQQHESQKLVDLTDRLRAQREMKEVLERVETAHRLRSQFLGNMSHELRTPMNSILGMLQLALGAEVPPEVRRWLATAKASSDSLLLLLNDLLDSAKIEAGKLEIRPSLFRLRQLLSEVALAVAVRAYEKGVELFIDVESDVPDHVTGDAGRLRQVITNLVVNAIKFTKQGHVVVSVTVEMVKSSQANINFSVADSGEGIAPEEQSRIFEPFIQSTQSVQGGAGLGLSIAGELVRRMGGEIHLESRPGAGSRFWFSLPLEIDPTESQDQKMSPVSDQLKDVRVLIIDHNEMSRTLLVKWFNEWAMQPESAIDCEHALRKLNRAEADGQPFRLVLADATIPVLRGATVAEHIADLAPSSPPLILMHAPGSRGLSVTLVAGQTELEKPILAPRLLDEVMRGLGIPSANDVTRQQPRSSKPESRSLRVLLAEDTKANQEVAAAALRRRGHVVTIVETGEDAVRLVEELDFDVVLMDVTMPVMDGYEATELIRRGETTRDRRLTIIALTAHATWETYERSVAAGMDAYLSKPIDLNVLVEVVETLAGKSVAVTRPADKTQPAETIAEKRLAENAMVNVPVMDYSATLKRLGGDKELFFKIVDLFTEDAPRLLEAMREAVTAADSDRLIRAAHNLKSLTANFGACHAMASASQLEKMGAAGHWTAAEEGIREMRRDIERLDLALASYRRNSAPG